MRKEINEIINIISKPYMKILPGNIAFSFMMAILPIISVIVFIMNSLKISPIININDIIPKPVIEMILIILNGNSINGIIFFIIAIITSSAGMDALIIASNVIYENESISYLKRKAISLFLTLLIIMMIIINFGILVVGDKILNLIIIKFNLNISAILFNIIKWPIAVLLIFIIIKLIYIVAPCTKIDFKIVNKGSIIATLLLILSSLIYSLYVSSFLYIDRYGILSNIIVLLIWLYILSFILVLGTAINVNEYKKTLK